MSDKITTAWVSKYALTEGVKAHRVKICGEGMVNVLKPDGSTGWGYLYKGDWHLSKDDADQKAEQMRLRKIASVKNQLARLEALSFAPAHRNSEAQ